MSSSWAPSGEPKVGARLRTLARSSVVSPSTLTWKRCRSKAPGWKFDDVGYAYVPGPLSSPSGSVTSSTTVPGIASEMTVRRSYPVAPDAVVTATVTAELPKGAGTVAVKAPSGPAVTVTRTVSPGMSSG